MLKGFVDALNDGSCWFTCFSVGSCARMQKAPSLRQYKLQPVLQRLQQEAEEAVKIVPS